VGTRLVTQASNRNGNAGRPYFKCLACRKFLVFDDRRGNAPANPPCVCGVSSKAQLSGRLNRRAPRAKHFVCRLGRCNFYAESWNHDGSRDTVRDDLVEAMAALSII